MLHSPQPIYAFDFNPVSGPVNTIFVPAEGLAPNILPKRIWASIVFQATIYFILILILNVWIRKAKNETGDALEAMRRLKSDTNNALAERCSEIEKVRERLSAIKAADSKHRIYTRRIYLQIDQENRFWRGIIQNALSTEMRVGKGTSPELIRLLLKKAGITQPQTLRDVNVDLLMRYLMDESHDGAHFPVDIKG